MLPPSCRLFCFVLFFFFFFFFFCPTSSRQALSIASFSLNISFSPSFLSLFSLFINSLLQFLRNIVSHSRHTHKHKHTTSSLIRGSTTAPRDTWWPRVSTTFSTGLTVSRCNRCTKMASCQATDALVFTQLMNFAAAQRRRGIRSAELWAARCIRA